MATDIIPEYINYCHHNIESRNSNSITFSLNMTISRPSFAPNSISTPSIEEELPRIVEFMGKDTDHIVFQRFEKVNLYRVLWLHQYINLYEAELLRCEKDMDFKGLGNVLSSVGPLLREYGEAIDTRNRLESYPRPPQHLVEHLKSYCRRNYADVSRMLDPYDRWEDLLAASASHKGWLHRRIDKTSYLKRLFQTNKDEADTGLMIYSENKIRKVEEFFVQVSFCLVVLGPVCALSFTSSRIGRLLILIISLIITSILTVVFANAAQRSNLAIMAAYTAILVVFLGTSQNSS